MLDNEYFTLHQSIVDRDDLTIHEKMCCVVLARYAGKDEFEAILSRDIIAIKMGCSNEEAYTAIEGLLSKGILESKEVDVELAERPHQETKVIKKSDEKRIETMRFSEFAGPVTTSHSPDGQEQKIQDLKDMFDEVVSEKALRILLNIAGGDLELIRKKYAIARKSQMNDVVEVLMHELQRKEPDVQAPSFEIDEGTQKVVNQINQKRIADLYKKNRK